MKEVFYMKSSKLFKMIILVICIFSTILGLSGCKQNQVIEKKFPELINELESYKLEATLETYFENGSKQCNVVVYYQSPNNYRLHWTLKHLDTVGKRHRNCHQHLYR